MYTYVGRHHDDVYTDAQRAGAGYESVGNQVVTSERPDYFRPVDYSGLVTTHADLITTLHDITHADLITTPHDRDLHASRSPLPANLVLTPEPTRFHPPWSPKLISQNVFID